MITISDSHNKNTSCCCSSCSCCCDWTMSLSTVFFSQSYHNGQLSLLRSISRLPVLSEHLVLSPVTKYQWQGENNLYESMYPY